MGLLLKMRIFIPLFFLIILAFSAPINAAETVASLDKTPTLTPVEKVSTQEPEVNQNPEIQTEAASVESKADQAETDSSPSAQPQASKIQNEDKVSKKELKKKAEALYSIGLRNYRQGKYKEALDAFNNVVEIYPHYKKLDYYLGVTGENLKEAQKKEQESQNKFYEEAKARYAYNLYAQGLYDMQQGRYQDAIHKFEEVLGVDPKHEGARENLVRSHSMLKKKEKEIEEKKISFVQEVKGEKIKFVKTAMERRLETLYSEAGGLLKKNWPEEALKKFEEIAEVDPEYKDIKKRLADTRLLLLSTERKDKGPPYTLGADDVIEINVQNHLELSGSTTVEAGGEIILPLLKEVLQVNGLTKFEAAEKIKGVLSKYIQEPEVQVVITGYNSKKWYILGEVGLRGEYPLGGTHLTLLEALYQAGLPIEENAAMGRVKVIKPHATKPYSRTINVASILYEGKMMNNLIIEPGDIIYIPKTLMNKFTTVLGTITAPISAVKGSLEAVQDASITARAVTPFKEILGPTHESKK